MAAFSDDDDIRDTPNYNAEDDSTGDSDRFGDTGMEEDESMSSGSGMADDRFGGTRLSDSDLDASDNLRNPSSDYDSDADDQM